MDRLVAWSAAHADVGTRNRRLKSRAKRLAGDLTKHVDFEADAGVGAMLSGETER